MYHGLPGRTAHIRIRGHTYIRCLPSSSINSNPHRTMNYLDQFKKQFAHIIPKFNAGSRYSFTWNEKVMIEHTFVEIGGHPICKTCKNDVFDAVCRIMHHIKSTAGNPKVININTPLPPETMKKDAEDRAKQLGIPRPRNASREQLIILVNNHITANG